MTKGCYLKFYMQEATRLHGILAYEWLLGKAESIGIAGGTAFRAVAGFGRHHEMHMDQFFELGGRLPVEVGFAVSDEHADRLLALLRDENVSLFFVRLPAEFGVTAAPRR